MEERRLYRTRTDQKMSKWVLSKLEFYSVEDRQALVLSFLTPYFYFQKCPHLLHNNSSKNDVELICKPLVQNGLLELKPTYCTKIGQVIASCALTQKQRKVVLVLFFTGFREAKNFHSRKGTWLKQHRPFSFACPI